MTKILPTNWSVNFAMDGECEKARMTDAKMGVASLISSLNLGSEKIRIE